jgi:hypothetical protein
VIFRHQAVAHLFERPFLIRTSRLGYQLTSFRCFKAWSDGAKNQGSEASPATAFSKKAAVLAQGQNVPFPQSLDLRGRSQLPVGLWGLSLEAAKPQTSVDFLDSDFLKLGEGFPHAGN